MEKESKIDLFLGSSLIFVVSQALNLYAAFQVKGFLETNQIALPEVSAGPVLLYFLGVAFFLGISLFLVPAFILRIVLKVGFAFLYSWGTFVFLVISLPVLASLIISLAGGLMWLMRPVIWLHNLLMILALVSAGSVFGPLFSPWTVIIFLSVLSIYDILAVRFGYMMWLVKQLSGFETLPAFVIPKKLADWNLSLKEAGLRKLMEGASEGREFSILGGGDIGLPLILMASVFFAYGATAYLIVAAFSLLGLILAYLLQIFTLKGKPLPALPPISLLSVIGFLIVILIF